MRQLHNFPILLVFLFFSISLFGQQAIPVSNTGNSSQAFLITPESSLKLLGTTNVANFSCDCEQEFTKQPLALQVISSTKVVFHDTDIKIKANLLDCGNKKMNRDMHETLNADQHPYIIVALKSVRQTEHYTLTNCPDWVPLNVTFSMTLNGITHSFTTVVKGKQLSTEKYKFKGTQTVCMSDFGIEAPRPFLGLIVVDDQIMLDFDLVVQTGAER